MAYQSQDYSQAARRLVLAVIHQAISDAFEGGENTEAAKQWLASSDCEFLLEACACAPEGLLCPQQRSAKWIS